jgi:hypothetical protein
MNSEKQGTSGDFVVFFERIRYSSVFSLGFLLLIVALGGVFAYYVSPLRDISFQPDAANAGSLLPWLRGFEEKHWFFAANVLALLVSTNMTLVFSRNWSVNNNHWLLRFILMIGVWLMTFSVFWMTSVWYLIEQWLID